MKVAWSEVVGIDAPLWIIRKEKAHYGLLAMSMWIPFLTVIILLTNKAEGHPIHWPLLILFFAGFTLLIMPFFIIVYLLQYRLYNKVILTENEIRRTGWMTALRILKFSPETTYSFKESISFTTLRIDKGHFYFETRVPGETIFEVKTMLNTTGAQRVEAKPD